MTNKLEERIKVQCGAAEVPDGEPEPWFVDEYMDKLKGDCDRVGTGVRVTWTEEFDSVVDFGVSVVFPWIESQPDTGCVVFFAEPDPMSDKGDSSEPEWQTLWDLLKNPNIEEVMFFPCQPVNYETQRLLELLAECRTLVAVSADANAKAPGNRRVAQELLQKIDALLQV